MFCGMGYINLFMMGKNLLLLLFVFIIVKCFLISCIVSKKSMVNIFPRDVMLLSGNRRLAFILFPNAGHMVIFQWIAPVAVTVKICV